MAIYQFYMAAIPKKGIIDFFGEIPNKLEISFQKETKKFLNNGIKDNFSYFEFIQHKCWSSTNIKSRKIINFIDQKLDRAKWGNEKYSYNWKSETKNVDNDAWIFTNKQNNQILELTFRADLRQPNLKFLIEMIELSQKMELLLMDENGNLVGAEIENVVELIKKSNALKFVDNPIELLINLSESRN